MITCIDKNGMELNVDFIERNGGDMTCQVYNKETNECVETFRIKAVDLGFSTKELIAQKHTYATAY